MSQEKVNLSWLYEQLQLPKSGIDVVEYIRHSEPVRNVDGGGQSVCVTFVSKLKMRCTINAESRTVEYPFIVQREFDEDTIEYYDQPYKLKLAYHTKKNRKVAHLHTPDFLVITKTEIYFVECKSESKLIALSARSPEKFVQEPDGTWRCPPGEEAVKKWGIGYRVVSTSQLSAIFTRNCEFLSDYYFNEPPDNQEKIKRAITSFFNLRRAGNLKDLLNTVENTDFIYWGLVLGFFYLDIDRYLISRPESARIYSDKTYANAVLIISESPLQQSLPNNKIQLKPNHQFTWDSSLWTIINAGKKEVVIKDEMSNIITLSKRQIESLVKKGSITGITTNDIKRNITPIFNSSTEDLEVAIFRYREISLHSENKTNKKITTPLRTIYEWKKRFRQAEKIYGVGLLGLIPGNRLRGNRTKRLLPEVQLLIEDVVQNLYATPAYPTRYSAYAELKDKCEQYNLTPCSYETFCLYIRNLNNVSLTKKTLGSRAAYQLQGNLPTSDVDLPPDGDRAFEVAHIDHTPLDIKIISSLTGELLGNLWLTILVCAYSKKILSHFLTFDPPSYRSSMVVIRECVRIHGRLPNRIVVDRGPDFRSIYFDYLIVAFCDAKLLRPTAQPKYGNPVERVFGTTNTGLIHLILGNTKKLTLGRNLSSTHHSNKHAVWTAGALNEVLTEWLYKIYPNIKNTGTGETPENRFNRSIKESGKRLHTLIPYDETFFIMTLPAPKRPPKVRARDGIRVNYFTYWNPALNRPDLDGKYIEVRYDPFDLSYILAYVENKWISCTCQHQMLREFTERDVRMAAEELKHLRKIAKQSYRITPAILVEYLRKIRQREADLYNAKKEILCSASTSRQPVKHEKESSITEDININDLSSLSITTVDKKVRT